MSTPAISVILPFSKEGIWLQESVESILQQTFSDFELLLTANNSDANTIAIASALAKKDPRIILSQTDGDHLGKVLNTQLLKARGKYIARMDADDISLPHRLEQQLKHLEQNPLIGLSSVQTAIVPGSETGNGFINFMQWQNSLLNSEDHYQYRFTEAVVAHPTVMIHRTVFENHGYYPEEGPEDFGLWLHWLQQGIRFEKLPEQLLLWRDHPHRLSRTGTNYTTEAFANIKARFASTLIRLYAENRKVILCGAGTAARKKMKIWEEHGITFHGYSDLVQRTGNLPYHPPTTIRNNNGCYYISLLNGRGKAGEMRTFFESRGLQADQDYIIAS